MTVTLRRKRTLTGTELYQVWPDDHPAYLPEPPWRRSDEFCRAIRGAMVMAFLLLGGEGEVEFTQEEWDGFFKATKESAASDPTTYADWGSY